MNIIYTCITAGKDDLRNLPRHKDWEFVCFTDDPDMNPVDRWDIRPLVKKMKDPRRTARWHKTHPHTLFPDADITIWIDGSAILFVELNKLGDLVRDNPISCSDHRWRICAYEEAIECQRLQLDDIDTITRQMDKYKKEGYPENNGLCETFLVIRKSCPEITEFNELWHSEIYNNSKRDQLSFNYCLWKLGITCKVIPAGYNQIVGHRVKTN